MYTYVLKPRIYYSQLRMRWEHPYTNHQKKLRWPGQRERRIPQQSSSHPWVSGEAHWRDTGTRDPVAPARRPSFPIPSPELATKVYSLIWPLSFWGGGGCHSVTPHPEQTKMTLSFKQERHHHVCAQGLPQIQCSISAGAGFWLSSPLLLLLSVEYLIITASVYVTLFD